MEIKLIIDTENKTINILYNGYNIIRTTICNKKTTKQIYEILKNAVNDEDFAEFVTDKDFENYLELEN